MLVDSHCHLDFPELAGRLDQVLADMATHDVGHALCVCVTLNGFEQVLALAMRDDRLSASVGVHPDHEGTAEPDVETLVRLAGHPKVVAVGETGLDYYRAQGDTGWQRDRFRIHIRAARLAAKPLIIHTRAASADTLALMREERADEAGGVMHCFTEDWATAKAALDLGFYLSFSGIVTFRNAAALREVAAKVPDDRLLIETDAPYLAPVPHRGKTNEPAFVRFVAASLAELRKQALDRVAETTSENFFNLFKDSKKIVNA